MKYQQLTAVAITALSSASMVSAIPSHFMRRDTVCPAGYSPSVYYVTVTATSTPTPTPTSAVQQVQTTSASAVSTNLAETESLPICGGTTSEQATSTQNDGQKQLATSAVQTSTVLAATTSAADVAPVAQQTTSTVDSAATVAQVKTSSTSTTSVVPASSTSEAAPTTTSTSEVAAAVVTTSSTSEAAATTSTTSSAATAATSSSSSSSSSTALGGSNSGQATYYTTDGVNDGTCSFSGYTLPSGIFGTALSDSNWDTAAHCGACVQVTSSSGKSVKAMIVDQCPGCGENHLDLFPAAFSDLAALSVGVLDVTWDYVECGISSPISLKAKDGSSQYWFSMQVVNSNLPVTSLEVSTDGGKTWQATTRTYYNFFEKDGGFGTETVDVRITSETGSTLVIEGASCSSSASTTGSSNF